MDEKVEEVPVGKAKRWRHGTALGMYICQPGRGVFEYLENLAKNKSAELPEG